MKRAVLHHASFILPTLLCARGCATMRGVELDKIYCADCRAMRAGDDGSVQLIVTSPPDNVGKEYAQHPRLRN